MAKEPKQRPITPAAKAAHKKYMSRFCEIKFRTTPERREEIQSHAKSMKESATQFINRAIDEQMKRDREKGE